MYNKRVSWLIITFVQLTLSSGSVGGGQGTEEGGGGIRQGASGWSVMSIVFFYTVFWITVLDSKNQADR